VPDDLRSEVTVFVLSVGEPTLLECLMALDRQETKARIERIENVVPMDRALQVMLDRCETPYYVQCDADMILNPDAIRRLYRSIMAQPAHVYQLLIALADTHLEQDILGVRIVRHAIAKKYPFQPVQGCETDQMRLAAQDGYTTVARIGPGIGPAGVHKTSLVPREMYGRYRTLFRRSRKGEGIEWVKPYAAKFLRRLVEDPNEVNLYACLGVVAGLLAPLDVEEGEKNAAVVPDELRRLYDHFDGVFR